MRLRNVPGSREAIEQSEYTVNHPEEWKGRWGEMFSEEHPLYIEIGMGKGKFLTEMAVRNPKINFIGIEKYSSVLIRAIERRKNLEETQGIRLDNLIFLRMDAEMLTAVFDEKEVDRIFLNFSDPWPKERNAKRRLTGRTYLERYRQILKQEGQIEFKTDNRPLFDFSLEQIPLAGFELCARTFDLHHDVEMSKGNIMTEYEEKFSEKGNPICKYVIRLGNSASVDKLPENGYNIVR